MIQISWIELLRKWTKRSRIWTFYTSENMDKKALINLYENCFTNIHNDHHTMSKYFLDYIIYLTTFKMM
ncbi:hypothetical protein AVL50_01875 [Flammeovirga sp. SJP92]|nr:hypothetical protein AVL50_01875 [Flammeovirga sp. SJP92]